MTDPVKVTIITGVMNIVAIIMNRVMAWMDNKKSQKMIQENTEITDRIERKLNGHYT